MPQPPIDPNKWLAEQIGGGKPTPTPPNAAPVTKRQPTLAELNRAEREQEQATPTTPVREVDWADFKKAERGKPPGWWKGSAPVVPEYMKPQWQEKKPETPYMMPEGYTPQATYLPVQDVDYAQAKYLMNLQNAWLKNTNLKVPEVIPNWDYKNPPVNEYGIKVDRFNKPLPPHAIGFQPDGSAYFGPGFQGWLKKLGSALSSPYLDPYTGKPIDMDDLDTKEQIALGFDIVNNLLSQGVSDVIGALQVPADTLERALSVQSQMAPPSQSGSYGLQPFAEGLMYVPWGEIIKNPAVKDGLLQVQQTQSILAQNRANAVADFPTKWQAGAMAYTGLFMPEKMAEAENRIRLGEDPYLVVKELENPWIELAFEIPLDPLNISIPGNDLKFFFQGKKANRLFFDLLPELKGYAEKLLDAPLAERGMNTLDELVQAQLVAKTSLDNKAIGRWIDDYAKKFGMFKPLAGNKVNFVSDVGKEFLRAIKSVSVDTDDFAEAVEAVYKLSGTDKEVTEALQYIMKKPNARMYLSRAGQMTSHVLRRMAGDNLDEFFEASRVARMGGVDTYARFMEGKMFNTVSEMFPTLTERISAQKIYNAAASGRAWSDEAVKMARSTMADLQKNGYGEIVQDGGRWYYNFEGKLIPMIDEDADAYKTSKLILDKASNDPAGYEKLTQEVMARSNELVKMGHISTAAQAMDTAYRALWYGIYAPLMRGYSAIYMGLSYRYAMRNAWNNYFTNFVDDGPGAVFGSGTRAKEELEAMLGFLPARAVGLTGGPLAGPERFKLEMTIPENVPVIGGKKMSPYFGYTLADNFEGAAAFKLMNSVARKAMERMTRVGLAIPETKPLLDAGLSEEAVKALVSGVWKHNYDVRKAVDEVMDMVRSGTIDAYRSLDWIDPQVRKTMGDLGITNETITALLKGTKEEAHAAIDELLDVFNNYSARVNDEMAGVPSGSSELVENLADEAKAFGLDENVQAAQMSFYEANELSDNAFYNVLNTVGEKISAVFKPLTPEADQFVKSINYISSHAVAPRNIIKSDAVAQVRSVGEIRHFAKGMSAEKIVKTWGFPEEWASRPVPELINEIYHRTIDRPVTLPAELLQRNDPFTRNILAAMEKISDFGQDVVPKTPKELRSALWDWHDKRSRVLYNTYRDTLKDVVTAVFNQANVMLPDEMKLNRAMLDNAIDQWEQATAFDADSLMQDLSRAFSKAFERNDIVGMIEARAKQLGIQSRGKPHLLNIINKYAFGIPDTTLARLGEHYIEMFNRKSEQIQAVVNLTSPERVKYVRDYIKSGDYGYAAILYDKIAAEGGSLPYELQNTFENWGKVSKAIANGELNSIPVEYRKYAENALLTMKADLDMGERGQRLWSSAGEFLGAQHSTYPEWYSTKGSDQVYRYAKYWDKNGRKLTGKQAVVHALDDMLNGSARKSSLVKRLSAVWRDYMYADDGAIGVIMEGVPGPDAFAAALKRTQDIIVNAKTEDALYAVNENALKEMAQEIFGSSPELREALAAIDNVFYQLVTKADELSKTAADWKQIGREGKFTDLKEVPVEIMERALSSYATDPANKEKLAKVIKAFTPYHGGPPTGPRVVRESRSAIEAMFDALHKGIDQYWGKEVPVVSDPAIANALKSFGKEGAERMSQTKVMVARIADEARNFALLNYKDKYGFDLALSMIYPYHFWYGRTYMNWAKRMVYDPWVWAAWAKYKDALASAHSEMPEWWRNNINSNDLPGVDTDNPFFLNIEQTIFPVYGLTGVNFDDPDKRFNTVSTLLDELDNFGPGLWSFFGVLTAMQALRQGKKEAAARLAGRLIPQTKDIRNAMAILGVKNITDYDPFINIFSQGLDPYDEGAVALMWPAMIEEGKYSEEEIAQAAHSHSGPAWDEAVQRMYLYRASGGLNGPAKLVPWVLSNLGAGFKTRTADDMLIQQYDTEKRWLMANKGNMTPDEYRNQWEQLNSKYPWGAMVSLSRGSQDERDVSWTYLVLQRIPPGQMDEVYSLFGVGKDKNYKDAITFTSQIEQFYNTKGEVLSTWSPATREEFISNINAMGAVLKIPDDATKAEWNAAKESYQDMLDQVELRYGKMIAAAMFNNQNYDARDWMGIDKSQLEAAKQFKMEWFTQNPELIPYYSSMDSIYAYYEGKQSDAANEKAGELNRVNWDYIKEMQVKADYELNLFKEMNPGYEKAKELQSKYFIAKDEAKALKEKYWEDHPELEGYIKSKAELEKNLAVRLGTKYGINVTKLLVDLEEAQATGNLGQFWKDHSQDAAAYNEYNAGMKYVYAQLKEQYGSDIFNAWEQYNVVSDYYDRATKQIGDQMESFGYWDLLEKYSELRDTLQKPIDAEYKKYGVFSEIKDKFEKQAARDILKVYGAIKPIKFSGVIPESEHAPAMRAFMGEQQQMGGVWDKTYADFKKNFTPTMQSVMKDYFEKDAELPDAMIDELEYIADQNNIDVYTLLELMRATY